MMKKMKTADRSRLPGLVWLFLMLGYNLLESMKTAVPWSGLRRVRFAGSSPPGIEFGNNRHTRTVKTRGRK